jgi:hypothetical protein
LNLDRIITNRDLCMTSTEEENRYMDSEQASIYAFLHYSPHPWDGW